ncbi:MAG: hypothetical protein JWO15_2094 [Sphingomonadales bacterium]|nr:hypothetical protein [Sphingomonadales bacterium]
MTALHRLGARTAHGAHGGLRRSIDNSLGAGFRLRGGYLRSRRLGTITAIFVTIVAPNAAFARTVFAWPVFPRAAIARLFVAWTFITLAIVT